MRFGPEVENVYGVSLVERTVGKGEGVAVGHFECNASSRDVVSVPVGGHAHHLLRDLHPGHEAVRHSIGSELDRAAMSETHLEYVIGWVEAQQLESVFVRGRGFGRHDAADQPANYAGWAT